MKNSSQYNIMLILPPIREGHIEVSVGIASIYSTLKHHGYNVDFFDCNLFDYLANDDEIFVDKICQSDFIGIGGFVSSYSYVKNELYPYLNKMNSRAVVGIGGYLGVSVSEHLLRNNICDLVFIGDAQASILEVLDTLFDKDAWSNISGISYVHDNDIINNGIRFDDLDLVSIPLYKYFDFAPYYSNVPLSDRCYYINAIQGCPMVCSFCINSFYRPPFRARNVSSVVDEIEYVVAKFKFKRVDINAENLLSHRKWLNEFCDQIIERGVKIQWIASGHAKDINSQIIKKLKKAGCYKIAVGFESFSQNILDRMNKQCTVEQSAHAIRVLRMYNMRWTGNLIFGYLGENEKTFKESYSFIKKNLITTKAFWINVYPNTSLWNKCIEDNMIQNKEEYIEKLENAHDFTLNISDLPKSTLFNMKRQLDDLVIENSRLTVMNCIRYYRLTSLKIVLLKAVILVKNKVLRRKRMTCSIDF